MKKQLRRDQMAAFFVNLPPCLIGMEACGSAHHRERKLASMGHMVRLMAPQFVKPYFKTNKNDAADAEAICEGADRGLCAHARRRSIRSAGSSASTASSRRRASATSPRVFLS